MFHCSGNGCEVFPVKIKLRPSIGIVFFISYISVSGVIADYNFNGGTTVTVQYGSTPAKVFFWSGGTCVAAKYNIYNFPIYKDINSVRYYVYGEYVEGAGNEFHVYIDGYDEVELTAYSFLYDYFENGTFSDIIATLQAYIGGEWVDVESLYVPAATIEDGPQPYQFGAYELDTGITDFRVEGVIVDATVIEGSEPYENGTYDANDVTIQTTYNTPSYSSTFSPAEASLTTHPDLVGDSIVGTVIGNIPVSTNSSLVAAAEVAAGITLAEGTLGSATQAGVEQAQDSIQEAVQQGVDASGLGAKLDTLDDSINALDVTTEVNVDFDTDTTGHELDYSSVLTNDVSYTNSISDMDSAIDSLITKVLTLKDVASPLIPTELGTIDTYTWYTASGSYTVDIGCPSWVRTTLSWCVHLAFWITTLLIIRSGVA